MSYFEQRDVILIPPTDMTDDMTDVSCVPVSSGGLVWEEFERSASLSSWSLFLRVQSYSGRVIDNLHVVGSEFEFMCNPTRAIASSLVPIMSIITIMRLE